MTSVNNTSRWNKVYCSLDVTKSGQLVIKRVVLNIFQRAIRYIFKAYSNTIWTQKKVTEYRNKYPSQIDKIRGFVDTLAQFGKKLKFPAPLQTTVVKVPQGNKAEQVNFAPKTENVTIQNPSINLVEEIEKPEFNTILLEFSKLTMRDPLKLLTAYEEVLKALATKLSILIGTSEFDKKTETIPTIIFTMQDYIPLALGRPEYAELHNRVKELGNELLITRITMINLKSDWENVNRGLATITNGANYFLAMNIPEHAKAPQRQLVAEKQQELEDLRAHCHSEVENSKKRLQMLSGMSFAEKIEVTEDSTENFISELQKDNPDSDMFVQLLDKYCSTPNVDSVRAFEELEKVIAKKLYNSSISTKFAADIIFQMRGLHPSQGIELLDTIRDLEIVSQKLGFAEQMHASIMDVMKGGPADDDLKRRWRENVEEQESLRKQLEDIRKKLPTG